jgi:hypothetical protein
MMQHYERSAAQTRAPDPSSDTIAAICADAGSSALARAIAVPEPPWSPRTGGLLSGSRALGVVKSMAGGLRPVTQALGRAAFA